MTSRNPDFPGTNTARPTMDLIIQHPFWFIAIVYMLSGAIYVATEYRREDTTSSSTYEEGSQENEQVWNFFLAVASLFLWPLCLLQERRRQRETRTAEEKSSR
jgi:hypothetical protein